MSRTFFAALLALCGLTTAAPAQMFYGGPTGYTSYYGPTYFHAPAYSPGYSSYSYTSGYRGGFGPLGVLNPATWFGWRPNRSAAYTSPFYGSTYAAAYSPSYSYAAGYSPLLVDTTTSYYAPEDGIALASYSVPAAATGSGCCPTACCAPCGGCSSCASGSCPGGNCAMNYSPSADMSPKPDPNISGSTSGTSGSRTFESQSGGANGGASGTNRDNSQPYDRERPSDGFGPAGSRSSGYPPQTQIRQKAPVKAPEEPEAGAGNANDTGTSGGASDAGAAGESKTDGPMVVPKTEEEPAAALDLDAKIAAGPSPLRERMRITARFGSPQLARAKVDPATLPAAAGVRLVQK
jgi:hypothetical protein